MAATGTQPENAAAQYQGWKLWWRWVGANAVAELIGLGGSAMVIIGMLTIVDGDSVSGALLVAAVSILLGTFFEGVMVGLLQWRVLRHPLPQLPRRDWILSTAAGAFVAWVLGMTPSTIMTFTADATAAAETSSSWEPGTAVIMLMAAAMGLVGGIILGSPQWWVLRRHVGKAGWWIAANSLAWMAGMMLIFAGATNMPEGPITVGAVLLVVLSVLAAGTAVGAIHGAALVWLTRHKLQ
jgi:hypothetical protein